MKNNFFSYSSKNLILNDIIGELNNLFEYFLEKYETFKILFYLLPIITNNN